MFNGVRCKSVQVPIFQQLSVYWDRPRNEKQYDAPSWAPCVIQQLPTSYLSILSMVTYTFQGYYLNSSHLLPPLCPQVSSLGKCLYSCPTNRFICTIYGSSVPFMVHPYHRVHICVNIWYLFFSFWLTSLCIIDSQSIHSTTYDPVSFFFMANIPLYICTTSSLTNHTLGDSI